MKLNTAARILCIGSLVVSFCFADPAEAAVQSSPQSFITQLLTAEVSPGTSFYQQQRDKLKFTPEPTSLSTDFSFLKSPNSSAQSKPTEPTSPTVQLLKKETSELEQKQNYLPNRLRRQKPAVKTTENKQLKETGAEDSNASTLKEKSSIQERIRQQLYTQKRSLPEHRDNALGDTRRDPYAILESARNKHSPLQGNSFKFEPLNPADITIRKPDFSSFSQQFPGNIDQLASDFKTNIQQQPEQLKQVLTVAKTDLQERSAAKLSGPLSNARALIQRTIKDPLSQLLKKIGVAAQEAAKQLK